YDEVYEHGYVALMKRAERVQGEVPHWLQRQILYDVMWQVRHFFDADEKLAFLTDTQVNIFRNRLEETFSYIESSTIETFELAGVGEIHRVGLLGKYKSELQLQPRVHVESADEKTRTLVVRW